MRSRLATCCKCLALGIKLLYDSRKTISNGLKMIQFRRMRYFVIGGAMVDIDEVKKHMPEACIKFLTPPKPRKMMIVANLKMWGNRDCLEKYCDKLNKIVCCLNAENAKDNVGRKWKTQIYPDLVDVVIAPPHPYLDLVTSKLKKECDLCQPCPDPCKDCSVCQTCECYDCSDCVSESNKEKECCKDRCLNMEDCDGSDSCQTKSDKTICECEDCGVCKFCLTCGAKDCLDCSLCVQTAAQNVFPFLRCGLSGEVSPRDVRELGCRWVIVGAADRRELFKECDKLLVHKARCALNLNMKVIYCFSDATNDKENNELAKQVRALIPKIGVENDGSVTLPQDADPDNTVYKWNGRRATGHFSVVGLKDWDNMVLVYEPLWAFKKGINPSPEEAESKCKAIRDLIANFVGDEVADKIRILYGGRVDPDTAQDFISMPSIDGFFVNTIAFRLDEFVSVVNAWPIKYRADASDISPPKLCDKEGNQDKTVLEKMDELIEKVK